MIGRRRFLQGCLAVALCAPAATAGAAPGDVVRLFYDALLGAMQDADALGYQGRYQRLEPAIAGSFNLPYMTRLAVGRKWTTLAAADKERLIDAFTRFTVAQYASQFDGYDGERFEVGGEKPTADGRMVAYSRMLRPKAEPIAFDYLLRHEAGQWRIVDVFLDGTISQLAARRSEFVSIIGREGVEGLLRTLEQKIVELSAPES